jgi:hypothetical protein
VVRSLNGFRIKTALFQNQKKEKFIAQDLKGIKSILP